MQGDPNIGHSSIVLYVRFFPIRPNALPVPQDETFTECHPWKENSCCEQETVRSVQAIKEAYGPEYHWDRCGPVSQACERFFVQVGGG